MSMMYVIIIKESNVIMMICVFSCLLDGVVVIKI